MQLASSWIRSCCSISGSSNCAAPEAPEGLHTHGTLGSPHMGCRASSTAVRIDKLIGTSLEIVHAGPILKAAWSAPGKRRLANSGIHPSTLCSFMCSGTGRSCSWACLPLPFLSDLWWKLQNMAEVLSVDSVRY